MSAQFEQDALDRLLSSPQGQVIATEAFSILERLGGESLRSIASAHWDSGMARQLEDELRHADLLAELRRALQGESPVDPSLDDARGATHAYFSAVSRLILGACARYRREGQATAEEMARLRHALFSSVLERRAYRVYFRVQREAEHPRLRTLAGLLVEEEKAHLKLAVLPARVSRAWLRTARKELFEREEELARRWLGALAGAA